MNPLDKNERAIVNRIQSDFPLTPRPFATIAEELGFSENQVIDILVDLKKRGFIRRIGGNFVPHKLDHVSTLCAAKVPEDQIDSFAAIVNRYPGVTHNYQRDNEYNIWFTFIGPSTADIQANLEEISRKTGVTGILNLPATRVFKIKAEFTV
jgi:DNA-binding Lrp family transcriptional regulator